MGRHLDQCFFSAALNRGKAIECFLGAGDNYGDEPTIRWVNICKKDDGFVGRLYEVVDLRDPEFLDVYELPSTAEETDEPIRQESFATLEAVLEWAQQCGGDLSRFVNEGMVGYEYGDYLERRAG